MSVILTGCDPVQPAIIDFKTFNRSDRPNNFLVCPKLYCNTKIDKLAPIFNTDLINLENQFHDLIKQQSRISLIKQGRESHHFQYVERSIIFHFPDLIDIQFISLGQNKSTLAIYSRAVYGYYDFNVNKRRVINWLAQLQKELSNKSSH